MFIAYFLSLLISFCTGTISANSPDSSPHNSAILSRGQITHLEKQATQWGTDYLAAMTPQQLQIITNMAYLLYVNILFDLSTRTYVPALLACTQKIQKKLQTNEDTTQELALAKTLAEKLQSIVRTRNVVTHKIQVASHYIDTNAQNEKFQSIISATQALQLHGQQLLCIYANNYKQEINECMTTNAKALDNIVQFLHSAADMYKKPDELNNLLPNVVSENKELVKIEIASNIAYEVTARGWESIAVSQNTMNCLTQLLKVARIVYGTYYQAAYTYMKTKNNNPQYRTHMFDVKGVLPAEYRSTPLPAPQELVQQFFTMQNISLNNQ